MTERRESSQKGRSNTKKGISDDHLFSLKTIKELQRGQTDNFEAKPKPGSGKARRVLRSQAHELRATVHVGKNGITDSVIAEIKDQVKRNKMIKVKLLTSCLEDGRKKVADEIAEKTKLMIVELKGNMLTLTRKR